MLFRSVHPVRDDAGEQREQEYRAEVRKLQDLDEKTLMGIADGLARDGPTLGGVLGPITGVRDAGADPEDEKRPMSENSQGPPDG